MTNYTPRQPDAKQRKRTRGRAMLSRRIYVWGTGTILAVGILIFSWPPVLFAVAVFPGYLAFLLGHYCFSQGRGAEWLTERARRRAAASH